MAALSGKRGNGEGAIFFDEKRNEWRGSIRFEGKRITFGSGKGGKKSDVIKKMQKWRLEHQQGYVETSKVTLDDAMESWLTTIKKPALKPASYDRLESTFRNQISPRIGHYDVKTLTDSIIKSELLDAMARKSLSDSSIKKAYDAMHAYLKYAAYQGIVPKDPMAMLTLPKRDTSVVAGEEPAQDEDDKVEFLTDDEIKLLYAATDAQWGNGVYVYAKNAAYIFILNTGLRMGEALALRWSDIDWNSKTVSVSKNLILVKTHDADAPKSYAMIVQSTPKSKKSKRTVPLNQDSLDALQRLKELPYYSDDGYIIRTKLGKPTRPTNFLRTFQNTCRRIDIRELGVHALRHTYATKLFEAGVDIKVISELLGHSSTEITYRIYVHVIEKLKREAVNKAYDIMPRPN